MKRENVQRILGHLLYGETIRSAHFYRLENVRHCNLVQSSILHGIMDRMDICGILKIEMGQFWASNKGSRFDSVIRDRGLKEFCKMCKYFYYFFFFF